MKTPITLATLPQATAMEVFQQVKEHLLTQNEKASSDAGQCYYRYDDLKCAAGCLISDEEYSPKYERRSWYSLQEQGHVPMDHVELIRALQDIHDHFPVDNWKLRLDELEVEIKNGKY